MKGCACKQWCADVSEEDDDEDAVCKELPPRPPEPPVRIVVVPKGEWQP